AEALERAVALAPLDAEARHHLALVRLARGETAAARHELDRCLEADPGHHRARLDRAVLALSRDEPAAALADLDACLDACFAPGAEAGPAGAGGGRLGVASARAAYYRAAALGALGRRAEAEAAFRAVATGTGRYAEEARRVLAAEGDT
ncbi:MAG TPA: hypothetical protein VHQ65_12125, partial [Thermoanaerobaculia bacterium]|nr:hypothetical protein [Thermoanaerobaculia bacterium]